MTTVNKTKMKALEKSGPMTKKEVHQKLEDFIHESYYWVQNKLNAPGDIDPLLSLKFDEAVDEIAIICVEQLKRNGVEVVEEEVLSLKFSLPSCDDILLPMKKEK